MAIRIHSIVLRLTSINFFKQQFQKRPIAIVNVFFLLFFMKINSTKKDSLILDKTEKKQLE